MHDDFWAKSSGTSLFEHTSDVLRAVDILHSKTPGAIQEEWWSALRYAALLHDLGKIDPGFQKMLKKAGTDLSGTAIPHSILSLFLFRPELFKFNDLITAHIVVSAVAFHHWRESFPDLLMGSSSHDITTKVEEFMQETDEWRDRCAKAADKMRELAKRHQLDQEVIGINTNLLEYLRYSTLGAAGILLPPYTLAYLPERIRDNSETTEKERFRIFVSGNLMRADHFASLVEESRGRLEISDIESGEALSAVVIDKKIKALFNVHSYWQKDFFTGRPDMQGESMILVAPTGVGKTEFSYLWGAGRKNFMLLPMRAATTKIFDRTQNLYGEEQVSLLHGDASLELFIREQKTAVLETEGQRRKAMDLARHLAKPYIVATADQIVPSALRYPGYERIFAALMNNMLIVDEIQAYDPRAAAIVTHLLQQNAFLGGKTLLMTATLPPFIRRQIVKRVGLGEEQIVNLLESPEFEGIADSARHHVQFLIHNRNYESVIDKAVTAASDGQKVLIVMNTVPAACAIYDSIRSELKARDLLVASILLHSRFTTERRKELETLAVDQYMPNRIERNREACIVVSTQIVEASLDIDADVLFTEPAPADSLVQRMGRVYRRYARAEGPVTLENANVFILVDEEKPGKGRKKEDSRLGSGVGTVYNRDLTVLSLVVLVNGFKEQSIEESRLPILAEDPWRTCFRPKKGRKTENANTVLCKIIQELGENSILLKEKHKMEWVEQTYGLLDEASGYDYPLNLGNYIRQYQETLGILDHGYCSDKRRDAMRLFRDVNDLTGIPEKMVGDFYSEVNHWIITNFPGLNYEDLATAILPKYLVACPYHSAVTRGGKRYYRELDLERLSPSEFSAKMQGIVHDKLERWLSGLFILELPYDSEKGLNYFDY